MTSAADIAWDEEGFARDFADTPLEDWAAWLAAREAERERRCPYCRSTRLHEADGPGEGWHCEGCGAVLASGDDDEEVGHDVADD